MISLLNLIATVIDIAIFFIIVQVILSWLIAFGIVNTYQPIVQSIGRMLYSLTEPLYRPIRRVLPDLGGVDLSPLVVLLLLQFIKSLMFEMYRGF